MFSSTFSSSTESQSNGSISTMPMDEREAQLDAELREMQQGYRSNGGLTSGDALASRLRGHAAQPISVLAHWIVGRNIVAIHRGGQTMIPMFQFETHDMSLRTEVQSIVPILSSVLDEWQVARWFAAPNAELAGATPADVVGREPHQVQRAAILLSNSRSANFVAH